jgi:Ca-activated chloride channel family protein
MNARRLACALVGGAALAALPAAASDQERPGGQGFSFRTGVELINVTATVTDANGRFVSGLGINDFVVLEDGKPQTISHFESERVPVSLGIALDTSGSMLGEKIVAAQSALNRFLYDLLGPQDEVFLYRFDGQPNLIQPWTTDMQAAGRALGTVQARGGTAMYDTVAEAVPLAQTGSRRKKALVIISDGNDTSSRAKVADLRQVIRESEVMVYAIGIDASGELNPSKYAAPSRPRAPAPMRPVPVPSPFPGKAPAVQPPPRQPPPPQPTAPSKRASSSSTDRLNADALRAITDDSGGRTEIIVSPRDLDPATSGIADELSRQYFLGYVSSVPKDSRWHSIDVQVRRGNYIVRARKGFIAN